MNAQHDLDRFVDAQAPVYPTVLEELRAGRKVTHWMWFVFPQIAGLGSSATARFYAIASAGQARAYMDHLVLGPRLKECTLLALQVQGRSADQVFGAIDAMKFRSSMTLFAHAAPDEPTFAASLRKYCADGPDPRTLALLDRRHG